MTGMDDCRALLAEWLDGGHTDDLRARTERFLTATDPGAAPAGYEAALAWFRADPERMRDLDDVDNRSAAISIVRAALARDAFGPSGRDLTAQDVDDALHIDCPTNEQIAERLNRIARPSGGVGQPDTAAGSLPAMPPEVTEALTFMRSNPWVLDPDSTYPGTLIGDTMTVVRWVLSLSNGHSDTGEPRCASSAERSTPEQSRGYTLDDAGCRVDDGWDHDGDLIASLQGDMNRLAAERDALVTAARGLLDALDGLIAMDYDPDRAARSMESAIPPLRALVSDDADPSPRSWSLPAPPPDDVTVVHVGGVRFDRDLDMWRDSVNGEALRWSDLLDTGTVVEGEPRDASIACDAPAPEPPFAVGDRVRSKSGETLGTVTEVGRGQALDERRVSFVDGWDRWIDVSDLEPAPEPQAAKPPRFEREVESIAVTLWRLWGDVSPGTVTSPGPIDHRFSDLIHRVRALAAAGAERVEGR